MPPSPRVKSISRTKAILIWAFFIGGIPLCIAGQWVAEKLHPAPKPSAMSLNPASNPNMTGTTIPSAP